MSARAWPAWGRSKRPPWRGSASSTDSDRKLQVGGIGREQSREKVPDLALRWSAEQGRGQEEGEAQEDAAADDPTGSDLHLLVIMVGPEQSEQVDPGDQGHDDPIESTVGLNQALDGTTNTTSAVLINLNAAAI